MKKQFRLLILPFLTLFLSGFLSLYAEEAELDPDSSFDQKGSKYYKITSKGIPLLSSVEATLDQQPNILIQKEQTNFTQGAYEEQSGAFDSFLRPSLTRSRANTPLTKLNQTTFGAEKQTAKITDGTLKLDKKLRNGVTLGPQVNLTQNNTTNDLDDTSNRANVDFVITVPLLRDRGRDATGAAEMAAQKTYESSLSKYRFVSSQSILTTVTAYWNYVAAFRSLEIRKESEARAKELVDKTKILVEKEERPRADLDQLVANLADKTSSRIRTEQTLTEQKQALGFAMGIPFDKIDELPLPSESFPEPPKTNAYPSLQEKDPLIKIAIQRRGDLMESKLREKAADILRVSSKNGLLHKLDINVSGGYSGLDEGSGAHSYFDSLEENVSGFNSKVGVSYEWPFENASARGRYIQSKATLQQRKIQTYDLKRQISSKVATAILALRRTSEELRASILAYKTYEKAVQNEKEKLRLGMSTFIDVIDIDDRLLSTKLQHVSAHQRYAIALAQLRFETGTFFDSVEEKNSLKRDHLVTIPLRDQPLQQEPPQ